MPYAWNEENQKQLLLAIIHATAPGPPKWEIIAKMLGDGATYDGVRKQFAKLKKEATEKFGEFEAIEGDAKPKAKGRGKKAASEDAAEDAVEDGEGDRTAAAPAKKGRKLAAAKAKGKRKAAGAAQGEDTVNKKVKAEEGDGGGVDDE